MKTSVKYKSESETVAIDIDLHFEHASLLLKYVLPFPLVPAKLIGDYFDNKRYGANKTILLTTRQFICAPNHGSVKRDAARTRKKNTLVKKCFLKGV
jgi:hypothetical protein